MFNPRRSHPWRDGKLARQQQCSGETEKQKSCGPDESGPHRPQAAAALIQVHPLMQGRAFILFFIFEMHHFDAIGAVRVLMLDFFGRGAPHFRYRQVET
jgi:hypothetical protein